MAIPPHSSCRTCVYYRAVVSNLTALRWVTLVPAILLPFLLIIVDIISPGWLNATHVSLYIGGVLGLVGLAYYGARGPNGKV